MMLQAAQTIEATVFSWAPFAVSVITLLTVLLKIGRWTQRAEDLASQAALTLAACRQSCDSRFDTLETRGTQFGVGHYATTTEVASAMLAVREILANRFDASDRRLGAIEHRLEVLSNGRVES